jgi:hypothetical protein
MKKLLIPIARDRNGDIVLAYKAKKEEGPFTCIEHKDEILILKQGKIKRQHFSHKSKGGGHGCQSSNSESWQHYTAKFIMAREISNITLTPKCVDCDDGCFNSKVSFLASHQGKVEYNIEGTKYRVDVAVLNDNAELHSIVEILYTHAVDNEKFSTLDKITAGKIYEVKAKDILKVWQEDHAPIMNFMCTVENSRINRCVACIKKRKRTCANCYTWKDIDDLYKINPTQYSKWNVDFSCDNCLSHCPSCNDPTVKSQVQRWCRCRNCNDYERSWENDVDSCLTSNNQENNAGELLLRAPEWKRNSTKYQNLCDLQISYNAQVERLRLSSISIKRWRWSIRFRMLKKFITRKRKELEYEKQEKERVLKEQRLRDEIKRREMEVEDREQAKNLLEKKECMNLCVPYNESSAANAAGAKWNNKNRSWEALGQKVIIACAKWVSFSDARVFELIRTHNDKACKRKIDPTQSSLFSFYKKIHVNN